VNTPTIPTQHRRRLQAHFGFTKLPFRKNMTAADMFDSRSQRDLLSGLQMWTELGGITLVTGQTGVGKSITIRRFVSSLDDTRFHVIKFSHLPTTPFGLLRSICRTLDLPIRNHSADLFDSAQAYLASYQQDHGPHPLLVFDDIEGLGVSSLDLLRRLTAYDLDAVDRFSMVLAGTEDVLTTLHHHQLSSLRWRIGYAQSLRPFNREDTWNYINFQMQRVDADREIFSEPAIQRIFQAAKGCPRKINTLCLYLLIQSAIAGVDSIDGDFAATHITTHPLYQNPEEN
jgi:type II secretory pathway predicted ATPase ExeA